MIIGYIHCNEYFNQVKRLAIWHIYNYNRFSQHLNHAGAIDQLKNLLNDFVRSIDKKDKKVHAYI